jgi:hypothetical protein
VIEAIKPLDPGRKCFRMVSCACPSTAVRVLGDVAGPAMLNRLAWREHAVIAAVFVLRSLVLTRICLASDDDDAPHTGGRTDPQRPC